MAESMKIFLNSLIIKLEKSFDDKTSLILTTDSELYHYLKQIK